MSQVAGNIQLSITFKSFNLARASMRGVTAQGIRRNEKH